MEDELKPCPFCGAGNEGRENHPVLEQLSGEFDFSWRVNCYNCRIGIWNNAGFTKKQAIKVWNQRS